MADSAGVASGAAGRYATALFELARDDKAIDEVAEDLDAIEALLEGGDDLKRLIRSPVFSREDQARAMAAVLEQAGVSALTQRFVGLVAHNRRLFALPAMIASFRKLVSAHRGEVAAEAISAHPLSQDQLTALAAELKRAVGRDVAVTPKVDESLLGGLVVKVGSRMIDDSLKTKLARLELAMKEVG